MDRPTRQARVEGRNQAGPSGGVLSNLLFARNASGHSNNCGNETVSVMSRTTCVTSTAPAADEEPDHRSTGGAGEPWRRPPSRCTGPSSGER
ncbi:hypothetical protein LV779_34095 [Streptomyces thinghirensis]|nr:hypothetical protein [Streptomyces thinghirensis]